jgi:hemerythrin-like domain-containing protein
VLEQILDFVKGFADSAHHMKEEDLLFPALERAGLPVEGGPVSVMLAEHRQARQLVADIGRAVVALSEGQGGDNSTLIGPARAYVGHLRSHIGKEDECLFPIADDRLNAAAREELAADFDVAQEQFGRERYFAYLKLFKGE